MKRLLLARPNHDPGTSYMFYWSEPLVKQAKDRGMKVVDVKGEDVNERNVVGRLKATKPEIVCLNGHGDRNSYFGHDFCKVLDCKSSAALAGTVSYVRACGCLDGLGESAVKNGCKAFIGYSEDFVIPISDEWAATPLRDPVAKPVMDAANCIVSGLIDGKTPQAVVEDSKKLTRDNIKRILYSPEFLEDIRYGNTLFALVTNFSSLGVKDDSSS